jgi:hypothetical protein
LPTLRLERLAGLATSTVTAVEPPDVTQVASRRVFSIGAGGTTDTTGDRGSVRRRWFADGRHAPP